MKEEDLNKIKMWYYKSEIDYFSSFTTLWIAFNAFYKEKFKKGKDFENIKSLVEDGKWKKIYNKLLDSKENFRIDVKDLKEELDAEPLSNDKGSPKLDNDKDSPKSLITGRAYPINVEDIHKMDQLFDVLYTIRNNLFHGDKSPSFFAERDQRLVKFAYKILHQYFGEILESEQGNR